MGAETIVAVWLPGGYLDFPRMRVRGCVEELDEARIFYSRGAWPDWVQMADWEGVEEGSVIRGLYRPLDISLREIDCSC
jgi:hypothetical protein